MARGAKGPFRVRELAEIWFGTEWTTLKEEKLFGLLLALDWQTLFVRDRQFPDLFHLSQTVYAVQSLKGALTVFVGALLRFSI